MLKTSAWNKNVYKKMTFQIPATTARKFRRSCIKSDVAMNMIIREAMKNYINMVDKSANSADAEARK